MSEESLLDALIEKYPQPRRKTNICFAEKCGKRELIDALAERGLGGNHIAHILKDEFGIQAAPQTVTRHMRRDCACQR